MSTLRHELKYMDFIVDKKNTDKMYLVLAVGLHNVWVYRQGDEAPIELPKRVINMTYMKVNPKSIKILFGDKGEANEVSIDPNVPTDAASEG